MKANDMDLATDITAFEGWNRLGRNYSPHPKAAIILPENVSQINFNFLGMFH